TRSARIPDTLPTKIAEHKTRSQTHFETISKPISTHGMTQKLNRHGIMVRSARNSALAALAADLPSPILADVTGMHRHTALRWVAYARRDWAEYLAARME
ncbi:hypothetical protein ACIOEG_32420, partial [Streptomyces albidoflavus]